MTSDTSLLWNTKPIHKGIVDYSNLYKKKTLRTNSEKKDK